MCDNLRSTEQEVKHMHKFMAVCRVSKMLKGRVMFSMAFALKKFVKTKS